MADLLFSASTVIAVLAVLITFIRLILGPSLPDRVVALDGMTIMSVPIILYIAHAAGRVIYLDIALVYALISFIGVVAVARYLEGGL